MCPSDLLIIIFYDLEHIKILRSRILPRNTKLKLRPILTYGPEAWTMTMEGTTACRMFERKVVKKHTNTEKRRTLENKDKQREKDILQGKDTVVL